MLMTWMNFSGALENKPVVPKLNERLISRQAMSGGIFRP